MKHILKNTTLVLGGIALAIGSMVFAATWQGTDTIQNGQIIEADVIKDNFDYLYELVGEVKASCSGGGSIILGKNPITGENITQSLPANGGEHLQVAGADGTVYQCLDGSWNAINMGSGATSNNPCPPGQQLVNSGGGMMVCNPGAGGPQ
ncbi:MAG: hypothetical protein ACKKL4_02855 [Patescibacteria group bacterium]